MDLIWSRVLKLAGESENGQVSQCPGETCPRWQGAKGDTYEEKSAACLNCQQCNGNPPINPDAAAEPVTDEIQELVDEIEDIIEWEDGGHITDWTAYGFAHKKLVTVWRKAERYVEQLRHSRIQGFLLSWSKQQE